MYFVSQKQKHKYYHKLIGKRVPCTCIPQLQKCIMCMDTKNVYDTCRVYVCKECTRV